jgi:cardiolipin synthase
LIARLASAALAIALAGCASIPPLDRHLLKQEREPVRVENARVALSHSESERILSELTKRAPNAGLLERHIAIEEALTDTALSIGNRAQPLEDGKAAYASMLAAIKAARHHVHMEMYIFEGDEAGKQFGDALAERARAGVKVRLIYDSVGSLRTPKEFFKDLESRGVQVVEFNPVKSAGVLDIVGIQNRDHRKLLLVDGRVAFLGGINISGVYGASGSGSRASSLSAGSGGDDRTFEDRPWRDLQVRLEGPVVADLQRAFMRQWERWAKEKLPEAGLFPQLKAEGPFVVRAIAASPQDSEANALYVALISAIEASATEVMITNAYFVPHPQLLAALKAAAQRGVDVKLLLPSKTDSALVYHAGRSFYGELLEAGVKIYERKSRLLHSKSAVVDRVWTTVGSTNLDWRSLVYNDELNAVILGNEFADKIRAVFERDLANSEAITLEKWKSRPFGDRIKETAARTWALWL